MMAPLIVLIVSGIILRITGALGVERLRSAREVTAWALAIMFLFTASAHFTAIKHDLAAMIPPPFTGQLWVIYVTGVLEIAGAVGLLVPRLRRVAALCLIVLLAALLPANVYAALEGVPLRGNDPTPLVFRIPLQIFWMSLLWWCSSKKSPAKRRETDAPPSTGMLSR
jgi:uncharacterized membrane protein